MLERNLTMIPGACFLAWASIFGASTMSALGGESQPASAPSDNASEEDTAGKKSESAVARFEKLYALEEKQILKRVAPPYSPDRLEYYRATNASQARAIPDGPDTMYFRYDDEQLKNWGMSFGGANIATVLRLLTQIYPQYIDAVPPALKSAELTGDFVVRPSAGRDEIVGALTEIIREEMHLPYTLNWRVVERDAIVVTGKFKFSPLSPNARNIEIFGLKINTDGSGGGGSGEFPEFLEWIGMWLGMPVVSEVDDPPKDRISWHYNSARDGTEFEQQMSKDPQLVLINLHAQTDLLYTVEKRQIRVLFIEKTKDE